MNEHRTMAGGRNGRRRDGAAFDWARFLATWVRHPLKVGAVAPSSPDYCAAIAARASTERDGPVLELGPGLGVITRALLGKGVEPGRLTCVEFDPAFAATLKLRYPGVNVVCGDGFDLDGTLGHGAARGFATIVLAIPILRFPREQRRALVEDYLSRLLPGGNLVQLSYLWTAPVKPRPGVFSVRSSPLVWSNIPPAKVWIYEADAAKRDGA